MGSTEEYFRLRMSSWVQMRNQSNQDHVRVDFRVIEREAWKFRTLDGATSLVDLRETCKPRKDFSTWIYNLLSPDSALRFISQAIFELGIPITFAREISIALSEYASVAARAAVQRGLKTVCMLFTIGLVTDHWLSVAEMINLSIRESEILNEEGNFAAVPAPTAAIRSALETKVFEKGKEISSTENCVVCMDEFCEGTELKQMPCLHIFHGECIVKWLEQSNCCPVCRFRLQEET